MILTVAAGSDNQRAMQNPAASIPVVPPPPSPARGTLRTLLSVALVLSMILVLPAGPEPGPYGALATIFASIVLEALPFMLFGALVGGLIEAFISRERMSALLPRSPLAAICVAAAMGLVFPVCECAVVPVVRGLVGKGLPFSAAVAYLLAGPIVNPIVAGSTLMAYGFAWKIAGLRLGLGYVIAVAVAVLLGRLFPGRSALREGLGNLPDPACACGCENGPAFRPFSQVTDAVRVPSFADRLWQALRHGSADFLGVGHYLVIGAFVAALAQTFVDRSMLLDMLGMPLVSIVIMAGLAVALNLCSEADAFIASSFRGLMPMSAQMAFMLTGPMFDLKLLLMYQVIFRKRAILALSVLVLTFTVAGACALAYGDMPWR